MMANQYFTPPNFSQPLYDNAPNIQTDKVTMDGVAPKGFYLTSHMPTYYKIESKWIIPKRSSLNCVATLKNSNIEIKELRDLKVGDEVIIGENTDGSEGILTYYEGFSKEFISPYGLSVESSSYRSYKQLFELMEQEKNNNGYIVWVLGPAVVFDHDTRIGLSRLAENGYVHSLLGGNAMATHDLEGGYLNTALGQDIYTQESVPMGHYNHLDTLNEIRRAGSINQFIEDGHVEDGFVKTLMEHNIPITLAGSIRDDGPLPEVTGNVNESLTNVKKETDKATLIICLATMLHSISTAELASSYRIDDNGEVKPVFLFAVDVTENAVQKVSQARERVAVKPIITNVQDFVVNLERALIPELLTQDGNPVSEEKKDTIMKERSE